MLCVFPAIFAELKIPTNYHFLVKLKLKKSAARFNDNKDLKYHHHPIFDTGNILGIYDALSRIDMTNTFQELNSPVWLYDPHHVTIGSEHEEQRNHTAISDMEEIPAWHQPLKQMDQLMDQAMPDLVVNPCLRDLEFQRVVDPFTAHQELSQYLSGVLTNNNEPPQLTDQKVKRDKAGFDNNSFKTRSPGKKAKRRTK